MLNQTFNSGIVEGVFSACSEYFITKNMKIKKFKKKWNLKDQYPKITVFNFEDAHKLCQIFFILML